jgi:hypothetical protein
MIQKSITNFSAGEINMSNLASGIYILEVQNGNEKTMKRSGKQ